MRGFLTAAGVAAVLMILSATADAGCLKPPPLEKMTKDPCCCCCCCKPKKVGENYYGPCGGIDVSCCCQIPKCIAEPHCPGEHPVLKHLLHCK